MLPSGCLPLRIRRYVQKSKFDHFSPDSNVVAYRCKPFRDRQADSWDISLSDIAVDPICRTSLDSRCKEDPEKGEKIESPGYRFLWYLSVFLVNLVLAILLAAGICLAGYTLVVIVFCTKFSVSRSTYHFGPAKSAVQLSGQQEV